MSPNFLRGYPLVPTRSHVPPLPRRSTIPLPRMRLSPLFGNDADDAVIPPVPFVVESRDLDRLLRRATWRPLPRLGQVDPCLRRAVVQEDFLRPATSPSKDCLMVVFTTQGERRDLSITSKSSGQEPTSVSVFDVIEAVQGLIGEVDQQWPAVNYHPGDSLQRAPDGVWHWRGLSEVQDETDVWML